MALMSNYDKAKQSLRDNADALSQFADGMDAMSDAGQEISLQAIQIQATRALATATLAVADAISDSRPHRAPGPR